MASTAAEPQFTATGPRLRGAKRHPVFDVARGMAVSLTNYLIRRTRLIPQVRAAIGQQLRDELEVPRSLPPELATLVTQLAYA